MAEESTNKAPEKAPAAPKKKRGRAAAVTLGILISLAIVGIAGYFFAVRTRPPNAAPPPNMVKYPTVTSKLSSSKDGTEHSIDVDLTVEYADESQEQESSQEVYRQIQETVSQLDYEALKKPDSVEYIENAVKEKLSETADSGEEVSRVYVGNISIDFPGFLGPGNDNAVNPEAQERLKGLFKSVK